MLGFLYVISGFNSLIAISVASPLANKKDDFFFSILVCQHQFQVQDEKTTSCSHILVASLSTPLCSYILIVSHSISFLSLSSFSFPILVKLQYHPYPRIILTPKSGWFFRSFLVTTRYWDFLLSLSSHIVSFTTSSANPLLCSLVIVGFHHHH